MVVKVVGVILLAVVLMEKMKQAFAEAEELLSKLDADTIESLVDKDALDDAMKDIIALLEGQKQAKEEQKKSSDAEIERLKKEMKQAHEVGASVPLFTDA